MNERKYSIKKGLIKGLLAFALFGVPFFITNFPDIANITIGSALVILANWIKFNYGK